MKAVSYDGVTFASLNVAAGWGPQGQGPYRSAVATRRTGSHPIHGGISQDTERVTVVLIAKPGFTTEATLLAALGALDVLADDERLFVGLLDDGVTTVQRAMAIESWRFTGPNQVQLDFTASDPLWETQTATTATQTGSVSPFSLSHTNAGQAAVHPRYRVWWTAQRGAKGTVVGQQYRRRMTLTNTQSRTLGPFPYEIALGDTAALVSAGKSQADGDDLRVILDGQDLTRFLRFWNSARSFAWVVIPGMDAKEVLTLDIVYGNANAINPPVWTDPDPNKPIVALNTSTATATGGSTTTLVRAAGLATNEFTGALLYMVTGANAGLERRIISNTTTTFTTEAFPSAIASGDVYQARRSSNAQWWYAVQRINRETDYWRGRWYLDSPKYTPNVVSYEAPGSWTPALVYDNRDSFGQARYSMLVTPSDTDKDPFALLDAARLWEGNDARVEQAGTADGVSIVTPCPITKIYWEYEIDNPNGMVQALVGLRSSGAEDWAEAFVDEAATSGLTTRSSGVNPLDVATAFGTVYQMVHALGPSNDIEIDLDWRRDTGSATSGTTTTTTDSTKEWATNQFANGSIRMLSGANSGRKRSVTSNTSTVITHAAFPVANADGDRYVLANKRLKGVLRDGEFLIVHLDSTGITASALGAETAVYDASMTLWVGDGPAGAPSGQHRALIGYAGTKRRLFLSADERVEIDSSLRRIRIWNTTSSSYTSELADPAVIVQYHDGTAWRRSADWLPLGTSSQQIWLEEVNIGTLSVEIQYYSAYLGA